MFSTPTIAFARTRLIIVALLAAPLAALGCDPEPAAKQTSPASAGLPDRDPALAKKLVAEGALLFDVRSPEEFGERHIDGATNMPVDEIGDRLDEIEALAGGDKKKPVVVYCRAGHRAGRAKAALIEAGYENVSNLGGLDDWPDD